jgi:hypothetical protein
VTALAQARMSLFERWTHHLFPLAVGSKAWRGGMACIDVSTGKCEPGHVEADLVYIGKFDEDVDATTVEKPVNVDLGVEIEVVWWNNDAAAPVLATHLLLNCYILDDQTVSIDATGRSVAGRVWAVDAVKGVAVQKTIFIPTPVVELDAGGAGGAGRTGPGDRTGNTGLGDRPIPPATSPGTGGVSGDRPIPPATSPGTGPGDRPIAPSDRGPGSGRSNK